MEDNVNKTLAAQVAELIDKESKANLTLANPVDLRFVDGSHLRIETVTALKVEEIF